MSILLTKNRYVITASLKQKINFYEEIAMVLSAHAAKRCRQRGIPESIANLILQVGDTFDAKRGCSIVMARTRQSKAQLRSEIKHLGLKQKKGWESAYLVVDHTDAVITAGHRTKKIKLSIKRRNL